MQQPFISPQHLKWASHVPLKSFGKKFPPRLGFLIAGASCGLVRSGCCGASRWSYFVHLVRNPQGREAIRLDDRRLPGAAKARCMLGLSCFSFLAELPPYKLISLEAHARLCRSNACCSLSQSTAANLSKLWHIPRPGSLLPCQLFACGGPSCGLWLLLSAPCATCSYQESIIIVIIIIIKRNNDSNNNHNTKNSSNDSNSNSNSKNYEKNNMHMLKQRPGQPQASDGPRAVRRLPTPGRRCQQGS